MITTGWQAIIAFEFSRAFYRTGGNTTSTYYRIKKLIKRSVHHANRIYALTEFYGRGQNIYRGIKFKLTNYHIDTGEDCEPRPR